MAGSKLHVQLLGCLSARAGRAVMSRFRTRKTAELFSYLALHSDHASSREMLVDLLWPESCPGAGLQSLSQALSSLRRTLLRGGAGACALLKADRTSVQLKASTDVRDFEAAVQVEGGRDARIAALTQAQVLYGGDLLPGNYHEWILTERDRLRDLFLKTTHELVSLLREKGDLRAAAAAAHRGVREDSLSEDAVQDLMHVDFEASQPQLALHAYAGLQARLQAELGERPSAASSELARRIADSSAASSAADELAPPPFTLVETSMLVQIAEPRPPSWDRAHARILDEIAGRGGQVLRDESPPLVVVFAHPVIALDCAMQVHRHLRRLTRPSGVAIEARLALDTFLLAVRHGGMASTAQDVLRLAQVGDSGDLLLSEATAALVRRGLEPGLLLGELTAPNGERLYRVEFSNGARAPWCAA